MLGNTLFCRALTVLQSQNDKGPEPLLHQQTFDSQKGEVISRLISKSDVLFLSFYMVNQAIVNSRHVGQTFLKRSERLVTAGDYLLGGKNKLKL